MTQQVHTMPLVLTLALLLIGPPQSRYAQAQLGPDDDPISIVFKRKVGDFFEASPVAVIVCPGDMCASNHSLDLGSKVASTVEYTSRSGTLLQWTLDDIPIGDMVVIGDKPLGPFPANSETHRFRPDVRALLARADFRRTSLRLAKVTRLEHHGLPDPRVKTSFVTPRTFSVSPTAEALTSDASAGRYLFHLESGRSDPATRVDHFLIIEFAPGSVRPELRWYVDAGTHKRFSHLHEQPEHPDWEVRPLDGGRLTPVRSARGHEMVPYHVRSNLLRKSRFPTHAGKGTFDPVRRSMRSFKARPHLPGHRP